ncbi:hypothetical protein [Arthrobacter sp. ISL-28]|uniref:hypothetical protein n=1 Tax=Arthrobacter sp. ISL-28 TaxID=2819108 RepID=UPI001BE6CB1F|nr:hypothetical protein [Arthrobacter sp. ISL-28]MBT2522329.1 hypothetical protein [Arthrobacter sp. ISL-28]
MDEYSEELVNLAFMALDHAIDSVVSSGVDLVPFVIREKGDQRHLQRYVAGQLQESVAAARQSVRDEPLPDRIALAWDGFMTTQDGRQEAVFVESYEQGTPAGFILAQRYQRAGFLKKKRESLGNPALVEKNTAPLF